MTAYQELKTGRKTGKNLKYIMFGLSKDLKEIVVLQQSESTEYENFLEALPKVNLAVRSIARMD